MIINHWRKEFTKLYGHYFPETYLCIDTEYTGGSADKDVIMEIGHTMVENRTVVDKLNIVLDWSQSTIVPRHWLERRMRQRSLDMGDNWKFTWEFMKREGIEPVKALQFYYDLITTWLGRGLICVAHNGYFADERMLAGNFAGFLKKDFDFGENGLFDTGAIVKGTLALSADIETRFREKFFPLAGDTLKSYFKRCTHAKAKGVKWNMKTCLEYFNLQDKVDATKLHTAQYDSWCCHLLMEEIRKRITKLNVDECPFDTPATFARAFEMGLAESAEKRENTEKKKQKAEDEFEQHQAPVARARKPERRRGQRSL